MILKILTVNDTFLHQLTKFLSVTEGRDKSTKVIQYLCKALIPLCSNNNLLQERLLSVAQSTSDARKIFRLGKFLSEVDNILIVLKSLISSAGKNRHITISLLFKLGALINYTLFYVFDSIYILTRIKAIQGEQNKILQRAYPYWILGIVLNLGFLLNEIIIRKKLWGKKNVLYITMFQTISDLFVAINALRSLQKPIKSNRSIQAFSINVCGILSALLGCYKLIYAEVQ